MFLKNSQQLKVLNILPEPSILEAWQGSEYTPVTCYSLFGKIEDTSKIDSVAVILKLKRNYYILRLTLSKKIMVET